MSDTLKSGTKKKICKNVTDNFWHNYSILTLFEIQYFSTSAGLELREKFYFVKTISIIIFNFNV